MKTFHKIFYYFMRLIIRPYFFLSGFRYTLYTPKSKVYLVLTNHNTNWDFFLAGLVLNRRHMYFVGSEHILRLPFVGPLIRFLSGLIPRKKGGASDETISLILQRLKEGSNVCMMAEGNRSFDGKTCFISPKTAQLVKDAGVGLITVAIHGGYFISPRWARKKRRGPYYGKAVAEYSPEELAAMNIDEINAHICSDLYVNAYDDQKELNASYISDAPAEYLETALFACPVCGSFSTLSSSGDTFTCSCCHTAVRLNDRGYFAPTSGGDTPRFDTILAWSEWQKEHLREYTDAHRQDLCTPVFHDTGLKLSLVNPAKAAEKIGTGDLTLYADRIVFTLREDNKEISVPLQSIRKISVLLRNTLLFTTDTDYYQIKGEKYCALKYLIARNFLVGKEYF